LAPLADEVWVDRLGNLIATKQCSRVLIAAHMDKIGFLVRHVDRRGFLRLQPLGSFDPRVLIAQRVVIHTAAGRHARGVIETTMHPPHFGPPLTRFARTFRTRLSMLRQGPQGSKFETR